MQTSCCVVRTVMRGYSVTVVSDCCEGLQCDCCEGVTVVRGYSEISYSYVIRNL